MDRYSPVLSPEVAQAQRNGEPVVALESAVLTSGLPFPHNIEAHRRQVAAVRAAGAVPATVAVLRGYVRVGLCEEEARQLAQGAPKATARDLACLMATGGEGGTTVAATVAVAARVGIPVMSTGGIGGVHRGAAHTFDVSADLREIAEQPVAVVCSGIKSLLDIDATLEVLETLSVPVVGLTTRTLPGFLTRDGGASLEYAVDTPAAAANLLRLHWEAMRRRGGVLLVHPVAAEHALDPELLRDATDRAIAQGEAAGIRGKELTPFLLKRVEKLSAGKSLPANLALLEGNANPAGASAVAIAAGGGALGEPHAR